MPFCVNLARLGEGGLDTLPQFRLVYARKAINFQNQAKNSSSKKPHQAKAFKNISL